MGRGTFSCGEFIEYDNFIQYLVIDNPSDFTAYSDETASASECSSDEHTVGQMIGAFVGETVAEQPERGDPIRPAPDTENSRMPMGAVDWPEGELSDPGTEMNDGEPIGEIFGGDLAYVDTENEAIVNMFDLLDDDELSDPGATVLDEEPIGDMYGAVGGESAYADTGNEAIMNLVDWLPEDRDSETIEDMAVVQGEGGQLAPDLTPEYDGYDSESDSAFYPIIPTSTGTSTVGAVGESAAMDKDNSEAVDVHPTISVAAEDTSTAIPKTRTVSAQCPRLGHSVVADYSCVC